MVDGNGPAREPWPRHAPVVLPSAVAPDEGPELPLEKILPARLRQHFLGMDLKLVQP